MRLKCFRGLLHIYSGPSKKVTEFAIWMNRGRFTWIKIFEKRGEGHSRINASGNRYIRNRPAQRREVTQRVELGSSMACEAGTSYTEFNQSLEDSMSNNFVDLASDLSNNSAMLINSNGYSISPSIGIITFIEKGLPKGQVWNVSIGGNLYKSTNSSIEVSVPEGDVTFLAYSGIDYETSRGSSYANGGNVSFVAVNFTPAVMYSVKLTPSGIGNLTWGLNISNFMIYENRTDFSGAYEMKLPNGTYNFTVLAPDGYRYNGTLRNIVVNGTNFTAEISFQKIKTQLDRLILEISLLVILVLGLVAAAVYYYRRR